MRPTKGRWGGKGVIAIGSKMQHVSSAKLRGNCANDKLALSQALSSFIIMSCVVITRENYQLQSTSLLRL